MNLEDLMKESHACAVEKGWWETERNFPEQIALQHSELSEVLESYRERGLVAPLYLGEKGKPEGIAAEYADVLIRICDTCEKYGIPLVKAIELKQVYNRTRPHRHGGKLC